MRGFRRSVLYIYFIFSIDYVTIVFRCRELMNLISRLQQSALNGDDFHRMQCYGLGKFIYFFYNQNLNFDANILFATLNVLFLET